MFLLDFLNISNSRRFNFTIKLLFLLLLYYISWTPFMRDETDSILLLVGIVVMIATYILFLVLVHNRIRHFGYSNWFMLLFIIFQPFTTLFGTLWLIGANDDNDLINEYEDKLL